MSPLAVLETERLILRRWKPSDRSFLPKINSDPRVMQFMPSLLSTQESECLADRIEAHFQQHGFGLCAAENKSDGQFIGFIGLSVPAFETRFTPCVEVGWRIAAEFWGRGLATEGARSVLRYGFEILGLKEIVSFTVPANQRSRRVMEKLGMTHDPADDFDHPRLTVGHPLRRHILYRLQNPAQPKG